MRGNLVPYVLPQSGSGYKHIYRIQLDSTSNRYAGTFNTVAFDPAVLARESYFVIEVGFVPQSNAFRSVAAYPTTFDYAEVEVVLRGLRISDSATVILQTSVLAFYNHGGVWARYNDSIRYPTDRVDMSIPSIEPGVYSKLWLSFRPVKIRMRGASWPQNDYLFVGATLMTTADRLTSAGSRSAAARDARPGTVVNAPPSAVGYFAMYQQALPLVSLTDTHIAVDNLLDQSLGLPPVGAGSIESCRIEMKASFSASERDAGGGFYLGIDGYPEQTIISGGQEYAQEYGFNYTLIDGSLKSYLLAPACLPVSRLPEPTGLPPQYGGLAHFLYHRTTVWSEDGTASRYADGSYVIPDNRWYGPSSRWLGARTLVGGELDIPLTEIFSQSPAATVTHLLLWPLGTTEQEIVGETVLPTRIPVADLATADPITLACDAAGAYLTEYFGWEHENGLRFYQQWSAVVEASGDCPLNLIVNPESAPYAFPFGTTVQMWGKNDGAQWSGLPIFSLTNVQGPITSLEVRLGDENGTLLSVDNGNHYALTITAGCAQVGTPVALWVSVTAGNGTATETTYWIADEPDEGYCLYALGAFGVSDPDIEIEEGGTFTATYLDAFPAEILGADGLPVDESTVNVRLLDGNYQQIWPAEGQTRTVAQFRAAGLSVEVEGCSYVTVVFEISRYNPVIDYTYTSSAQAYFYPSSDPNGYLTPTANVVVYDPSDGQPEEGVTVIVCDNGVQVFSGVTNALGECAVGPLAAYPERSISILMAKDGVGQWNDSASSKSFLCNASTYVYYLYNPYSGAPTCAPA